MKTKILLFLVFVGVILILPKPAFSQEKNPEALKAVQKLKQRMGSNIKTEWRGPNIVKLEGNLSLPSPGTPEETAKQFLKENAAIFQMPSDLSDVEIERMREDKIGDKHLGYYVRFKQTYKGLPIFKGGGVGISLKQDKSVSTVSSSYLPNIDISTTPTLSENEAIDIAKDDHKKNCQYREGKRAEYKSCAGMEIIFKDNPYVQLGISEHGEKIYLIYKINLATEFPVYDSVEYVIDANSGTILDKGSLTVYFDGTGKVFDPNPVNTLNNTGLQDNRDKDNPIFNNAYFIKTLQGLSLNNGFYYLSGPYVDVTDALESPFYFRNKSGYISSTSGNFNFTRSANEFEHVMAYYHIDTNQRYIQSLGFANINNRRIKVDPHGLLGADDSHYQLFSPNYPPGAGYLAFGGSGGITENVDDAEDADIILHEYGHAIQDNQAPGKYIFLGSCSTEAGAMGEGFGDYWAASNTYNISIVNVFDPACIGEWDAVPNCLRRVDGTKHYPEAIVNECHADGEIWSAALWDLFNSIGKTTADTLILYSHFIINNDKNIQTPTFCDGAKAIIDADQQLYGGTYKNTIAATMMNRGIGTQATKFVILDPTDSIPGTPVTVTIQAQNCFDAVVTDYQNNVTLVTSGSATGGGLVDIINGVGTIEINDAVAETVNLSLSDTQSTGLDISSTQDVIFCGAVTSISGPDAPQDGDRYTTTEGAASYTWSISKGSITQDGIVTVSGQCGVATVSATDACGFIAKKDVRMPSGVWKFSYYLENCSLPCCAWNIYIDLWTQVDAVTKSRDVKGYNYGNPDSLLCEEYVPYYPNCTQNIIGELESGGYLNCSTSWITKYSIASYIISIYIWSCP